MNAPLHALARISCCPWPPPASAAAAAAPEQYALGAALRLACKGGGRLAVDSESGDLVGAIKALNAALRAGGSAHAHGQQSAEKAAADPALKAALELLESPVLLRALLAGRAAGGGAGGGAGDAGRSARGAAASTSTSGSGAAAAASSAVTDIVDMYWPMVAVGPPFFTRVCASTSLESERHAPSSFAEWFSSRSVLTLFARAVPSAAGGGPLRGGRGAVRRRARQYPSAQHARL